MKKGLLLFTIIILCSCAGFRVSKFTPGSVKLGDNMESVINRFGRPFKTDSYIEDKKLIEIIYYKEPVDVSGYIYMVTSILTFEESILTKIEQSDERIISLPRIKSQ